MLEHLWDDIVEALGLPSEATFVVPRFPWDLLEAWRRWAPKVATCPNPVSSAPYWVEGPVGFGANVKIGAFSVIRGPSYIGDNTVIGDHVAVNNSYIGSDCVIGEQSIVRRSVVGSRSRLFHKDLILDSVVGYEVTLAAANVANVRSVGLPKGHWRGQVHDLPDHPYGAAIESNVVAALFATFLPGSYCPPGTKMLLPSLISGDGNVRTFSFLDPPRTQSSK